MRATAFEFRFRLLVLSMIAGLGFWSPGFHGPTVWMLAAGWLAHNHWLGIQAASLAAGEAAAALALLAAMLRTWATAYLGSSIVFSGHFHSDDVVAAGPFRYLRNPLYLGTEIHFLALSFFMPSAGALFVLAANALFLARIIAAEESHLRNSPDYRNYFASVPRLAPAWSPRVPASGRVPRWGQAFLAEVYCWGVASCFAALVPQYNAMLILQGVVGCFGLSLVVKGVWPAPKAAAIVLT